MEMHYSEVDELTEDQRQGKRDQMSQIDHFILDQINHNHVNGPAGAINNSVRLH